jgi:hypothetical protein
MNYPWKKCGHPSNPERQEDCYVCAKKALENCRETLRRIAAMTVGRDIDITDPYGHIIWRMAQLATDALEEAKGCPRPRIVDVRLTNESVQETP